MGIDQLLFIAIIAAGLVFCHYALIRARSAKRSTIDNTSKDAQCPDKVPGMNTNSVPEPTEPSVKGPVNQNGGVDKKSSLNEEVFLNQYRSLYAVLADKNNPKRKLCFPTKSEELMWFFVEVVYKAQSTSDDIADFCTIYASNILAGYCFRTTEEALAGTKSCRIEMIEISKLIKKHQENQKREMGQDYQKYVWKDANINNTTIYRFVFLDALRKDSYYQKFLLFDKVEIAKCMYPCLEGIRKSAKENLERSFAKTFKSEQKAKEITQLNSARFEEEAGQDFFVGYCLRLSESLMPY
jgi:hypothetical protein